MIDLAQKKILIIGYKGFIGSNLFEYFNENQGYIVTGIDYGDKIRNLNIERFDYTIFAAGNSKTYLTKKDPIFCIERDFTDLLRVIKSIDSKKFILLSSSLVYNPQLKIQDEDSLIDVSKISLYGSHKLLMEKYVKEFFSNWLILRPASFFGIFLKKNLLFDLKNNKKEIFYHIDSKIDFINIHDFCIILDKLKEICNQTFNVGSGITFSLNEILSMKKNQEFVFVSDHLLDNSNFSVKKMEDATGLRFNRNNLNEQIYNFVNNLEKR